MDDDEILAEALVLLDDAREIIEWTATLQSIDGQHPIIVAARKWMDEEEADVKWNTRG